MKEQRKGFTLIELLLVVTMIGILAAMVVPRLVGKITPAKIKIAHGDIQTISGQLAMYEIENEFFPTTEQGLKALVEKPTSSPVPEDWNGPYLRKIPVDPWKKDYKYRCPATNSLDYDLYSTGPDGNDGNEDDITNWK